jgi:hypothetical protein
MFFFNRGEEQGQKYSMVGEDLLTLLSHIKDSMKANKI